MAARKNKTSRLLLAVVAIEDSIRAVTLGGSLQKPGSEVTEIDTIDTDDAALVSWAVLIPSRRSIWPVGMNLNPVSLLFEKNSLIRQ